MRKRMIAMIAAAVMALSSAALFSSCSMEEGQTYAWVLGTASPEDTVTGIFAEKFAELVGELSDGEMKVQVYHNSILGGDTELLESCQCGDIPFVVQNTAPQVSYLPQLALFDLPMVFDNLDQLHTVLDDETFMRKINAIYKEGDLRLLAMGDQDFRVMSSNVNIDSIDDFKGVKIRTMENNYHIQFWSALHANPTPMAFAELYVGLEQNTVDAQENPYEVIVSNRFYEVQDYVVETNHLPHLLSLITNDEFYQNLSGEEQAVIDEAAEQAVIYAREQAVKRADARKATITESGTQIVKISDELKNEMRSASDDLYQKIRKTVNDDELFEQYTRFLKESE